MNLWNKLFRGGGKPTHTPPVAPQPSNTKTVSLKKTEEPMTLGTSYVETVFSFDLANKPESQDWRKIHGLCLVPGLVNGFDRKKDVNQAEAIINDALGKFPDYSFVHSWRASICE